ncbi:MAG: hypothetical protein V2J89_17160 [Halieaceae bacterium]|jgi:hypothetical protein|nr:hypothetical protein [Halieaceae bacterium]
MNLNFNTNFRKVGGEIVGPVNTIAPAITGTAERGQLLTCSTGTWTGTGTITYAYQWLRGGAPISGATANTYTLVAADDNNQISCRVTATDSEGSRSKNSNSVLALGAPFNLTAPVLSGNEQVGQTLSVTNGTWQGVTPITYSYKWFRNGLEISGATSSSYTLVAADYNTVVYCQVIASNAIGTGTEDSNATGAIAGIGSTITGVPTFVGTENVGEDLTATYATANGVPTPTNSIQWQRSADGSTGWANISGATSLTYTLVLADEGQYVRAVQTATNPIATATAASVSSGIIGPESVFDPDYQAVLDYATTQGYTLPSAGQQTLQNQLVVDLKAAGVWPKLDSFAVFATDGNTDFALIDWKRTVDGLATKKYTAISSPIFTTNQGFTGDGVATKIETNYNPVIDAVNYSLNSASLMAWVNNYNVSDSPFIFGGGNLTLSIRLQSSSFFTRINSNNSPSPTPDFSDNTLKFKHITRQNASVIDIFQNTTITPSTQTSSSIPTGGIDIFEAAGIFGVAQVSVVGIGGALNSENTNYFNAVNNYMTSI